MNLKSQVQVSKLKVISCILPIACFLCLTGCGPQHLDNKQQKQVNIAGTWETAGKKPWKITLEPDGSVSEVMRPDGIHMVLSQGSVEMQPTNDLYAKYTFGSCFWGYDPKTHDLEIVLNIDEMYVKTAQAEFRCSIIDEFSGPLSPDGQTWTPEWVMKEKQPPPRPERVFDYGEQTFTRFVEEDNRR